MPSQLETYKRDLDATIPDIVALRELTKKVGYLVTTGKVAVAGYKKFNKIVDNTTTGVKVTDAALTVLGLVTPIKTPVKALQFALKKVKKPVEQIDKKLDEIGSKDDTSTPKKEGPSEALQNVELNLAKAGVGIAVVLDSLTLRLRQLEIASEAMGNFNGALAVATATGETWSGKYTALNVEVESQLQARNDLIPNIEAFFKNVKADVEAFLNLLQDIDFEKILGELVDLGEIAALFDFLEKPLQIAGSLLEPILPLLNAVGALIGLIIDPVIEYIMETLTLDKLLDGANNTLDTLVPTLGLLSAFEDLFQPLQDFLLEYIIDAMGTVEYLDLVESIMFGDVVGEADKGPTGWGNDVANILTGDDGDDILDALGDRDIILGKGGDDVIIAGAGNDFIDGGAGDDLIYFNASFTEYELARDPDTGNIIVGHLAPSDPEINTGIDVLAALDDTDHVAFTDISFTGLELNNAIIGGSVLHGNVGKTIAEDIPDLMFLNSSGTKVGGYHVANGHGGDDRIFGSTEDDQLNGGTGNDILLPGLGDDQVNGDSGVDTFQVLEGANREISVDLINGTSFGQGRDVLTSIENVVVSPGQNHEVRGNDVNNAIYTGDEIDVISGLGGDDTIDSGGEDDFIIGGQGADIIMAGSGNTDVMISGSKAEAGVSDLYLGGDGFDVVSYTSSSNTIKFDINNKSDDPRILQVLKDYMVGVPDSGPVEIRAGAGEILRFDMDGDQVSTDYTRGVEGFMGSDQADLLLGDPNAELLHGAGGDDIIHTGGTENINGGRGDDLIHAENVNDGSKALQIDGGDGFDRLTLDAVGDARWYYKLESAIALTLRAHQTSVEGEDLRNARDVFFSIKPRNVEEISLGNFADHAIYNPGGSSTALFFLLGGNDRFDGENGFADVSAGDGNDIGNFAKGGGGIFRGMAGDDYAIFDNTSKSNAALMGEGRDFVQIERFFGEADGGDGFDTIAFDVNYNSRIVADLAAGTVKSFKGVSTNVSDQVGMTLKNFEELIATGFNDLVDGSDRDEQVLGGAGNDTIRGAGGRDKLFGGAGNDRLEGGADDDLLHGGPGIDILDGGTGSDTASYAWARPGGLDGALIADGFTGVTVNLLTGTATGAFGSDTLISIENAVGTGGDDSLQGDDGNNLLSGGAGDDDLVGNAGDDVLVTGSGTDMASGGDGNDTIVIGLGDKTLSGGADFDTLDFGTVQGIVTIDFVAGTYDATFDDQTPRWSRRDVDGDGINESDGTEARLFNGVLLTPQDVFETDPAKANSLDDTTRVLPNTDDPDFDLFQIELKKIDSTASGTFSGFEKAVGGESGATILLSDAVDRFDGRVSARDMIDLSGISDAMTYNLRTGANNIALLAGDEISGVEDLKGGQKRDRFTGDDSNNTFLGGAGRDVLKGSGGKDDLLGGIGNDVLRGGAGKDIALGSRGNDKLFGNAGNDRLLGGVGDDLLNGGRNKDSLKGGAGSDRLFGGDGNDNVLGGNSADTLNGGKGADFLAGGNGADTLVGGRGADVIVGGKGRDELTGNGGADIFIFAPGHGRDKITDMELGVDTITIQDVTAADITITTRAFSTQIAYGTNDVITLRGITDPIDVMDLL